MKLSTFKLGATYPVFIEQIETKKDPVSGKWLKPGYSTDVELIAEKEGFQRYFKDGSWHYVVDNIGTEYWDEDGTKHTITELGEEVPDGGLLEAPIIPITLEAQTALANVECTKRINYHWNQIGQINASLGVYGEEDTFACAAWIAANREALIELLNRDDLTEIDVTEDQFWPVFK
ncbi:hypothetical protein [Marinomonas sp.]